MRSKSSIVLVLALCAVAALLYVGRFALPSSMLYTAVISPHMLMIVGGWSKLIALVAATIFAARSAAALGGDNPAWGAWLTLACGLGSYSLGQATLASYQTITGVSPFPSAGDIFFLAAYPLLITALARFIVVYARSGFPMAGLVPIAAGTSIIAAAIAWPLLAPIASTPASTLETSLNLAYPLLDLVLLVPAVVLLSMAARFHGGVVWRIWAALLAGVLFTVVGDIGFAWFSTFGYQTIDPLVHAMYILAYGNMALGASVQYRLVTGERSLTPVLVPA